MKPIRTMTISLTPVPPLPQVGEEYGRSSLREISQYAGENDGYR